MGPLGHAAGNKYRDIVMSFAVQLEDPGAQLLGISIVLSEKPCL